MYSNPYPYPIDTARWFHPVMTTTPKEKIKGYCENKNEFGWAPVKIITSDKLWIQTKLKNGLLMAYPLRQRASPINIRFIVHPSLIEENTLKINNYAVARARMCYAQISKYIDTLKPVTEITLLPPKKPVEEKYYFGYLKFPGKHTTAGAIRYTEVLEDNAVFRRLVRSSSNSGNHWEDFVIVITTRDRKLKLRHRYVSTRGAITIVNEYTFPDDWL